MQLARLGATGIAVGGAVLNHNPTLADRAKRIVLDVARYLDLILDSINEGVFTTNLK
jgi:hypothetical protein